MTNPITGVGTGKLAGKSAEIKLDTNKMTPKIPSWVSSGAAFLVVSFLLFMFYSFQKYVMNLSISIFNIIYEIN
ncbi:hypothetical protein IV37_GL001030 [Fructilactobacillus fructivorans]|nr:hypothetical protein IV37_GL001030 [Fructilactobacillus fructivorans]